MDNASKALIMAGAVLIAVALVGVGVYLYRSAADTVTGGGQAIAEATVQLNNSIITKYTGRNVMGSEILNLLDEIKMGNDNEKFAVEIKPVTYGGSGDIPAYSDAVKFSSSGVLKGGTYRVYTETNTSGAVTKVGIQHIEN